jgi:hypothetical protein
VRVARAEPGNRDRLPAPAGRLARTVGASRQGTTVPVGMEVAVVREAAAGMEAREETAVRGVASRSSMAVLSR